MTYKVTISKTNKTFPIKGLNELLKAETHTWDARMKKKVVSNKVKADNDTICRIAIQKYLHGVKIDKPIRCHYYIFVKDKMHDRGNVYASLEKSFLDALQQKKVIKNDTFDLVLDSTFHTDLDRNNPRIEVIIEEVEINNGLE